MPKVISFMLSHGVIHVVLCRINDASMMPPVHLAIYAVILMPTILSCDVSHDVSHDVFSAVLYFLPYYICPYDAVIL